MFEFVELFILEKKCSFHVVSESMYLCSKQRHRWSGHEHIPNVTFEPLGNYSTGASKHKQDTIRVQH